MQILQHINYFGDVELSHFIRKVLMVESEKVGEVTPMAILKHVVQMFGVLVALLQFDDTRMADFTEQFPLNKSLVLFRLLSQFLFLNLLDGIKFSLFFGQRDLAIGSFAQRADDLILF